MARNVNARQLSYAIRGLLDVKSEIDLSSIRMTDRGGGTSELFTAQHITVGKVALKRPRLVETVDDATIELYLKEAETWQKLMHKNVLQFLGVCEVDAYFYLVSPYADNGTLLDFMENHPDVDRVRLLWETADALVYLHANGIIHGDIKASNILVSKDLHALLSDFGLAKIVDSETSTALKGAGTFRWQAPELWSSDPRTFKTDVWAFGMTIAEVLTGEMPFPEFDNNFAVLKAVAFGGHRPKKEPPESPTGQSWVVAWDVAEMCWEKKPEDRPSMDLLCGYLHPDRSGESPRHSSSQRGEQQDRQILAIASTESLRQSIFAGHARLYIEMLEFTLATRPHVCRQVILLLHDYHVNQRPFYLVYKEMAAILGAYPALLNDFTSYFPSYNCYALENTISGTCDNSPELTDEENVAQFRNTSATAIVLSPSEPFATLTHYYHALARSLYEGQKGRAPLPEQVVNRILRDAELVKPLPSKEFSPTYLAPQSQGCGVIANNGDQKRSVVAITRPLTREDLDRIASVQIRSLSKDQGWTTHANRGSMSWFEAGIVRKGETADQAVRWKTHHNEIASKRFKEHIGMEFGPEHPIWQQIRPGDRLAMWAVSVYPGWACIVRAAELRVRVYYDPGYQWVKEEPTVEVQEKADEGAPEAANANVEEKGHAEKADEVERVTASTSAMTVNDAV